MLEKIWNWKTKTLLVVILLTGVTYWLGSLNRDNGQSTWANWYDCASEGWNIDEEADYNLFGNKCAIIYYDDEGNVIKKVPARLNVNTADTVEVEVSGN